MLLQLVFSEIGNLHSCKYRQGYQNSSDSVSVFYGIVQVGFFSTLVDIWEREQRWVRFIVMP